MTRGGEPGDNAISGLTSPDFAIIGTGRCGTRYMSHVLHACSLDCGHENWWTLRPHRRKSGLDGDSSWMALPSIELGLWSGPVVHITRHPVHVVSSLAGIEFFSRRRAFGDFALTHEPALTDTSPFEACVEWWARWNERCADVADLTIRVEDMPGQLPDVSKVIGCDLDVAAASGVPTMVNHRYRADVDEAEVWRLLAGRGERFGYHP